MQKRPDMPLEVELKLDIEPNELDNVLAHPLLQSGSGTAEVQHLHSTYFDTPDQTLSQAGISLRVRRNGAQRVQTIKAAKEQKGVALIRNEWEHQINSDEPDFALAKDTALEPYLNQKDSIKPIFTVSAERTLKELSYGGSLIEFAADRGRIDGHEHALPFGELELELKNGTASDLFGLALALAENAPLRLSYRTKAERGFEALSEKKPSKIKAGSLKLKRRMGSAEAFQIIGASCLKHLMANEPTVRERQEADAVHQMRVALRRLRAAMTLFKSIIEDEQRDQIKAELKWMANVLGEARDLDVYITKVLEPALSRRDNETELQSVLEETKERRQRAYETVQETIASSRFVNGILKTAAWIQSGAWVQDNSKIARKRQNLPVSTLAEGELDRRWKRILKRGKRLSELPPEERHQVRIEIKKLRYAAEFFESLFKGGDVKKKKQAALKTLEALQETLGELNDVAVGSHMHDLAATEAIHQEQLSRVEGLLGAAKGQYQDLSNLEPFWRD